VTEDPRLALSRQTQKGKSYHFSWLRVERLSGYAPELNPMESIWGNIKGREMANVCAEDLEAVYITMCGGLERARRSRTLVFSFLAHADLSFWIQCHYNMRASVRVRI